MASLKLPAMQATAYELPAPQTCPTVHGSHAVAPMAAWNDPAAQSSHSALDVFGCALPLAHGVGTNAPVPQKFPAGHSMQSWREVITSRLAFW